MIDRTRVKQAFASYVSGYDPEDPKIALKILHTYKVAGLCDEIAESLALEPEQRDVVWACGMLHDIGRFEQIRRYGTFVDAESVEHALLSTQILFGEPDEGRSGVIRTFIEDPDSDDAIRTAVRLHSMYRLPEDLSPWQNMCCQILRDADKLDIFRVNLETPLEQIYNVTTEALYHCRVSDAVMQAFDEHHTVQRALKVTPVDFVVGHICLAFELVYPRSRSLALEQGYLQRLMEFRSEDPEANRQMEYIRTEMGNYLGDVLDRKRFL